MARQTATKVAYQNLSDFIFGKSLKPVALKNGMVIGGGTVYPEINFTLPPMLVTKESMPEVIRNYRKSSQGFASGQGSFMCRVLSRRLRRCLR